MLNLNLRHSFRYLMNIFLWFVVALKDIFRKKFARFETWFSSRRIMSKHNKIFFWWIDLPHFYIRPWLGLWRQFFLPKSLAHQPHNYGVKSSQLTVSIYPSHELRLFLFPPKLIEGLPTSYWFEYQLKKENDSSIFIFN